MDNIDFEASASIEDDFWIFLDKVGKNAKDNGLNEEILDKLLNNEQCL